MVSRVLLIHESPAAPEALLGALSAAGFEPVATTKHGALAAALRGGPVCAVVLDLESQEGPDAELVGLIREVREAKLPVILCSDEDEQLLSARASAISADGWVRRSSGAPRLVQAIRDLCAKAGASRPSRRVMIVDDSAITARLIEAELKGKGFEILIADSAEQATRLILRKQSRPDLILLDVNMPNVDGAHFCRFIKSNALFKGIRVVLCSTMEVESLKVTAAQCGADGFVPKDAFLSKWVLAQIEQTERSHRSSA
jgi:DNA-binding response OmpR family regulator